MNDKIKIGLKIYLKPIGNMLRCRKEIKECTISKIGRKYFEVEEIPNIKFQIENLRQVTNYTPDWKVYFSKQEILDEQEYDELFTELRKIFSERNKTDLTLEQLRKIKEIVSE
jgi:hypothetical protein